MSKLMEIMKKAILSSNIEWKAWAERDPLYAVASCPSKRKEGPAPWTDDEFYELGRSDWQAFHAHWRDYGFSGHSCVEVGCGAGRISKQLVQHFKVVYALDISQHMLEYARQRVTESNVKFLLTPGAEIPLPNSLVTAAFSCHVFQHFNSLEVARRYFSEI